MKLKGILIALVIGVFATLLFTGCPLGPIDVSGTWSGSMEIEGTTGYTLDLDLDQDGSDITGEGDIGYSGIYIYTIDIDATISGNDIEGEGISQDIAYADLDFTAEVNDAGDEIDGDVELSNGNSGSFSVEKE